MLVSANICRGMELEGTSRLTVGILILALNLPERRRKSIEATRPQGATGSQKDSDQKRG